MCVAFNQDSVARDTLLFSLSHSRHDCQTHSRGCGDRGPRCHPRVAVNTQQSEVRSYSCRRHKERRCQPRDGRPTLYRQPLALQLRCRYDVPVAEQHCSRTRIIVIRREMCRVSKGGSGQRWLVCCPSYLRNLEAVAGPVANGDESPFFLAAAAAAASSPPEAYDRRSESHCTVTSSAQHTLRHTNVSTAHSGHSGLRRPSLCR